MEADPGSTSANAQLSRRGHAGYLYFAGPSVYFFRFWRQRYVRLGQEGFTWYKKKNSTKPQGEVRFCKNTTVLPHRQKKEACFELRNILKLGAKGDWVHSSHGMVVQATNRQDAEYWVSAIQSKIGSVSGDMSDSSGVEEAASPPDDEQEAQFHKRYILGSEIGEGSFSVVRKAMDRRTGAIYAVKCTHMSASLQSEIRILKKLKHPNVVGLKDIYICRRRVYLVLDYMSEGDLCDRLMKLKRYDEIQAAKLVASVAEGLRYIHSLNVVHRDIKPENILLDGPHVKISDFGLARQLSAAGETIKKTCGTPEYTAPELLEGIPYGIESDIFSLGIVTYVLLVGSFPFSMQSAKALQKLEVFSPGRDIREMTGLAKEAPQWGNVSDLAKDAVHRMLEKDPDQRISAAELLDHPWLASCRKSPELAERLERQRREELLYEGFINMARMGIELAKYGRKGYSHKTTLTLKNSTFTWTSRKLTALTASTSAFGSESIADNRYQQYQRGKGKVGIDMSDVKEIRVGHATPIFANSKSEHPSHCLSIVSQHRTLDLECSSARQRDWVVGGLRRLVQEAQFLGNQGNEVDGNILAVSKTQVVASKRPEVPQIEPTLVDTCQG